MKPPESPGKGSEESALHAEAQEIEQLAAELRVEFQAEIAPALRFDQREAILATLDRIETPASVVWWRRGSFIGAAAGLAVGILGTATVVKMDQQWLALRNAAESAPRDDAHPGWVFRVVPDEPAPRALSAPVVVPLSAPPQPIVAYAPPPALRLELPTFPSTPVLPAAPGYVPVGLGLTNEAILSPAAMIAGPRVDPATIPFIGQPPKNLPRPAVKDRAAAKIGASPSPRPRQNKASASPALNSIPGNR